MNKILGLDLGTNSIGWALIATDDHGKPCKIEGMGSRIIPMSQDILGDFDKGNSKSQTADRTKYRSARRLRERHLLRRERLHRVLNVLGFLPQHYADSIDFQNHFGKFLDDQEPKLAYNNNEFIFKNAFNEMLAEFKKYQPHLLENGKKVPYDWTIYYLRKKALAHKIEKEELAWLILNFNQKRGYYQIRGEEEDETPDKLVEFHSLRIVDVKADDETNKKGETWYSLHLENGWIYRRSSKTPLDDWKGKIRDFIVTTDLNEDGSIKTDKEGKEKRSFRAPGEEDWTLIKKKTEQEIENSGKMVGAFIFDNLLQQPSQKIRGKLVRTIERKFYKKELQTILIAQKQFHQELRNEKIFNDCVRELYRNNESHQLILSKKDFVHLFVEDIIFYQRPLRSQKSSIGNCTLEFRSFRDGLGNERTEYLKTIPKSNPLYQEFRIWQWLFNLRIYRKDTDSDVTGQFIISQDESERLFDFLNFRKEVKQGELLKYLLEQKGLKGKSLRAEIDRYRWNYVEEKSYPCNETGSQIRTRLTKVDNVPSDFLTSKNEQSLWHIIYSVHDKVEFEKALKTFAKKQNLDEESFVESFKRFPPFPSEYGTFSEKAIKKLLPLMRTGRYWNWEAIDPHTKIRINKIITGEYDDEIKNRVREKSIHLTEEIDFQGLPLWLAQYLVYDRHSEAAMAGKWNSIKDLEKYLEEFKQHSLRNPIVEQVVTETLRVVKDIWRKYGDGSKDFFKEIHIELGREMKNNAEDRRKLTNQIAENENTNIRIKNLLFELKNNSDGQLFVEEVRPYSPTQQEALKIYEEGVLNSKNEIPEDILKISRTAQPSVSDLQRYKLWMQQAYRSPYTGKIIPLSKLFTQEYQIEHIIPQSRYFDDSLSNKVICEAEVNQRKDNQLGLEFIKNHHGEKINIGFDQTVEIFSEEAYQDFVKEHFAKNPAKRKKLLLEEIPDKMIERQLNDTRYISKFISNLLSNIVRSDSNDDGINSKNLLPGNGKLTSILRQDWGLDSVWNDLILPRFERMNQITNSTAYTVWNENHHKYIATVPLEKSAGFQKKRIDHRHHALDALVIACVTRDHINLLNNMHAKSNVRFDLNRKLRKFEKVVFYDSKTGERKEKEVPKDFLKPWDTFTMDVKNGLEKIVVSFKQNHRIINKTNNRYEKVVEKNGKKTKELVTQTRGDNWAIRKPLHKETVSGKVILTRIKVPNGKLLTASRKKIDISFDLKTIESITDTGIQKILRNYLSCKGNNPQLAFSPEGLEEMNNQIARFNDGRAHQPVYSVRIFELGSKFSLGQKGNKASKFVEAAKGTNLFFAIYIDKSDKRTYETIPLNIVIERQKQGLSAVPEVNEDGDRLLFHLSPNDLVYVPSNDEIEEISKINFEDLSSEQIKRLYKIVSFTNNRLYGIPSFVAISVVNKVEYTQLNKIELILEKEYCIKVKVDRIGSISKCSL